MKAHNRRVPPVSSRFTLRGLMLTLLAFGLVGLSTELVFLEHYEDPWMLIPFVALAAGLGAVAFVALAPGRTSLRTLRVVMVLFIAAGVAGVALHYQGSLAFQVDMDPAATTAQLFWKVMHMKAPPTLAPGAMIQLGFLGLLAAYRHPASSSVTAAASQGELS